MNNTQETKRNVSSETANDNNKNITTNNDAKVKELENTISELKNMIAQLAANQSSMSTPIAPAIYNTQDDLITLISNTNAEVDIPFDTWRLRFSKIGQKNKITKAQFNELVNVHRFYFDAEFFLLDNKHIDLAAELKLPVFDGSGKYIKADDLDKVSVMSTDELRSYYNSLSEATKRNFVSFFLGQCNDKVAGFYDVDKMETMNNLTRSHLFDMMISIHINESRTNI